MNHITRRDCLQIMAATTVGGASCTPVLAQNTGDKLSPLKPKSVAAILTAYKPFLHSDVLVGKIFEGWKQDGGPGPALTVASMYVDQPEAGDLGSKMSAKHNVPIFDSIEKAITMDSDRVQVDGVISVGEHGSYPTNEKGQVLFPRRRFFSEIANTLEEFNRVVPVFSDKHLGPVWSDAKWMYDRARQLKIPMMAGSSMVVTYREPEVSVPMGAEVEAAVGIGYSLLDRYGTHTLEALQSLIERRRGGETGVEWVQCLEGDAMWKAVDDGVVRKDVLDAVLRVTPVQKGAQMRASKRASLFLFQYKDGLLGTVLMLPEYSRRITAAVKLKGQSQPLATVFGERTEPRYPHFAYLLKGIERMIHTGRPSYPVERTLLTSGILDRALTSRFHEYERLVTPELEIRYQPADYPHAPLPDLMSDPRQS